MYEFTKLLDDLAIISKLGDNPNVDDNLTPDELKAKFDAAVLIVQRYLNETLTPEEEAAFEALLDYIEYVENLANEALNNIDDVKDGSAYLPKSYVTSDFSDESYGKAADAAAVGQAVRNKAVTKTYKGTFLSSGWSSSAPYTQTITVEGVLSTDYPFVDIDLSDVSDAVSVIEGWKLVGRCTVSADNNVIAYCYEEAPAVDIPIVFKVVR